MNKADLLKLSTKYRQANNPIEPAKHLIHVIWGLKPPT